MWLVGSACPAEPQGLPHGQPSLDIIYIESNTGGASGGHLALKSRDCVFHFQQYPDGFFRLKRDSWEHFRLVYNDIENRSIYVAETPLPPEELDLVERHFSRFLLAQDRNFQNLAALGRSLKFRRGVGKGTPEVRIDCLGLFRAGSGPVSEDMVVLRKKVLDSLGKDFFSEQRALLGKRTGMLGAGLPGSIALPESRLDFVPAVHTSYQELLEIAAMKAALDMLEKAVRVDEKLLMDSGEITPCFRKMLVSFRAEIERSITELFSSRRPDRGSALLLQMARFQAVSRSIRENHLLVLDPFPDGAQGVSSEVFLSDREAMEGLLSDMKRRLYEMEGKLCGSKALDEPAYNALENLAARFTELRTGLVRKTSVRISDDIEIPCKKGMAGIPADVAFMVSMGSESGGLKGYHDRYEMRLKRLYRYNLITSNCVTRLEEEMEEALPPGQLKSTLTENFRQGRASAFVPFMFFDHWVTETGNTRVVFMPSCRKRKLAALYRQGNLFTVYLREFNTLTSTIYRSNPADTSFLIFTDDVPVVRPVYGAANVAWGLLATAAGVATAPFDHAERFSQGFWGVVYSLPELAFFNIRKGSFSWVRQE